MAQPPFHVTAARAGTCQECGRSLETSPYGVKLRLVGERTLGTIVMCRECFARALASADRGSAVSGDPTPPPRECRWSVPGSAACGHAAAMVARATRKDGSAVADLPLCDEHFTAFKLWWHDYAITVQRISSPQKSA
jgi:hypothetical protein